MNKASSVSVCVFIVSPFLRRVASSSSPPVSDARAASLVTRRLSHMSAHAILIPLPNCRTSSSVRDLIGQRISLLWLFIHLFVFIYALMPVRFEILIQNCLFISFTRCSQFIIENIFFLTLRKYLFFCWMGKKEQ